MKKIHLYLMLVLSALLITTSCSKEDSKSNASVEITVLKNWKKQSNVTVYMFEKPSTETFGNNPFFAKKSVVTDENGVAKFELQKTIDLEPLSNQTTLYFTIFDDKEVNSSIGVTIKKGEHLKKELKMF